VSTISPLGFSEIIDNFGSTVFSTRTSNILRLSTVGGLQGLFTPYVDIATSSLFFSNAAPNLLVAKDSVPTVSRAAALVVPNSENIFYSTTQSTLKFIGVGDLRLSTVTDLRTVFFSISSFSASGFADLSAETRQWRSYVYSTNSTSAGYATFVSSIPYSTIINTPSGPAGWDWGTTIANNIPLSTVESYPNYTTGDVYFSTVSFNMAPYARYIHPNSTTKMIVDVSPSYYFPRMFLGTSTPYNLVKEFSSFIQYEPAGGQRQIIATHSGSMMSQQSNAYTSNYFNTPLKFEIDSAVVASNALTDGYSANYTLYHRIPGAMATLLSDGGCDLLIGARGGFSNPAPTYDNCMSYSNSVFMHVYNQQGAAPPMPGP